MPHCVITGIGMISPLGTGVAANWNALIKSESAVEFDSEFGVHIARVKNLPLPPETRGLAMAFLAAKEALSDAHLDTSPEGVKIGQAIAESKLNLFNLKNAATISLSGQLRNVLQLSGARCWASAACATSSMLVINACKMIEAGEADIVLCGTAEASIHPLYIAGFNNLGVLSTKGVCPFDTNRDGFAISEGAAFIVVESAKSAVLRNAKVYAQISGYGTGIIGSGLLTMESSKLSKVIENASLGTVPDYVHMHGTATKLNDYEESQAFASVYGQNSKGINFSSTKGATGHMLGVSGAVGIIFSALAIKNNIIPPTLHFTSTDIPFDLNYTPNKAQQKTVNAALSASYGFGAQGTAIMLKKPLTYGGL